MTAPSKILLIDDDAVDRASVRRALGTTTLVHDIVEAFDGTTGLTLAKSQTFDCVLLDYRLPDVDTFELLATLISSEGGNQAVIMLTGEADPEVALRLMRAGALDYLSKMELAPASLARAIRYAKARRHFLSELKKARQDAEAKSLALDALNRQKSLLFSIIAHDLRNPFQVLIGLSNVLSQAVAARDHASVERRAQGIREAATQAYSLMEGLFAWASLQMDSVEVALGDVDLENLALEIARNAAEEAANKGIMVRVECNGLRVRGHRDMLAAVLRNLVSNAIKFTLPNGVISISAARSNDSIDIAVSDSGVGMTPNVVADIFRLDRRTTTIGTAGERGSGLGLLLCRDLVERQGSELTVKSVLGRGTSFRFFLPIALEVANA
jgi:two-component system sensor histidine kinase/response regulator